MGQRLLFDISQNQDVLWVGLFALIVVTTASLQKLSADSRDKKLRELYIAQGIEIEDMKKLFDKSLKENETLKSVNQNITAHILDDLSEKK